MPTTAPTRHSLPPVMVADVAFSGVSGSALLLGAAPLGDWFGLPPTLLAVVGALVVVHAAILWWASRRPDLLRPGARYAVVANLGWVAGAIAVLVAGLLTAPAAVALTTITLVVGAFGVTQWRLLRSRY